MTINKILKIANIGIFKEYSWKTTKPADFTKYNAIYGWNGTGKTTLARIFSTLATGDKSTLDLETDSVCIMTTSGGQVKIDFGNDVTPIENIRVFNEDFVNENLKWIENKANPILIVGKEKINQKEKLAELLREKAKKEAERDGLDIDIDRIGKERYRVWERARNAAKDSLAEFSDISPKGPSARLYRNYTVNSVDGLYTEHSTYPKLSDEQKVLKKKALAEKEQLEKIGDFVINADWYTNLVTETGEILTLSFTERVSSTIKEEVSGKPELFNWLKAGHSLHLSSESPVTCKFCQNEISAERYKQLDEYFDVEWNRLTKRINELLVTVPQDDIGIPMDSSKFYKEFEDKVAIAKEDYFTQKGSFQEKVATIKRKLKEKERYPYREIDFDAEDYHKELGDLQKTKNAINTLIKQHNEKTDGFSQKRQETAHELEMAIVGEYYDEYKAVTIELDKQNEELTKVTGTINDLNGEIRALEAELRDHGIAADRLNTLLASFLDRKEIQFDAVDGGYVIRRNAKPARNLSEGERNAIALIFFLTKLKEDNLQAQNSIIVIDDPISSFDSQYTHQAVGFIKAQIKDIKPLQLFVFTHNFHFFRQIRHWFKREGQDALFMLKSRLNVTGSRHAFIEDLDALLKEHDSEYAFLFKKVYERSNQDDEDLSKDYVFPNVLRKLLENYLSFKVPSAGIHLNDKLNTLLDDYRPSMETSSRNRIESYTQENSHPIYQESPTDFDERLLGELKSACRDVVELIRLTDEKHYQHLLKQITPMAAATS